MGSASTEAKKKYNKKSYDRVYLYLPTGQKAAWQSVAEENSQSLNEFIIQAVGKCLKEK